MMMIIVMMMTMIMTINYLIKNFLFKTTQLSGFFYYICSMNIIFLDIDGVMRTHNSDLNWSRELNQPVPNPFKRLFSKDAMENLNYLVTLTGAKVVITSTWRMYYTLTELKNLFRERGFIGQIIGTTSVGDTRGEEIVQWLNEHRIDNFVVIDDNIKDILNRIPDCKVVKCNPLNGLDEVIFDKALDILG